MYANSCYIAFATGVYRQHKTLFIITSWILLSPSCHYITLEVFLCICHRKSQNEWTKNSASCAHTECSRTQECAAQRTINFAIGLATGQIGVAAAVNKACAYFCKWPTRSWTAVLKSCEGVANDFEARHWSNFTDCRIEEKCWTLENTDGYLLFCLWRW